MTRGERRLRRNRPWAVALLGVLLVGLALIASAGADPWLDPAHRSALVPTSLLVAYAAGSLVVGTRRRRT